LKINIAHNIAYLYLPFFQGDFEIFAGDVASNLSLIQLNLQGVKEVGLINIKGNAMFLFGALGKVLNAYVQLIHIEMRGDGGAEIPWRRGVKVAFILGFLDSEFSHVLG